MSEWQSTVRTFIEEAEAVVVGAGSGMSAAAGLTYTGRRFREKFGDFIEHYGMTDMYSAGFYPFPTQEENGRTGAGIFIVTATMFRLESPIWICISW